MSNAVPTIGRIVHYTLSSQDAAAINRRRDDAARWAQNHGIEPNGRVLHSGNKVDEGDVFPLIITRIWGNTPESSVNGQLLLDGNDTYWVTSASEGDGPRHWVWPPRV